MFESNFRTAKDDSINVLAYSKSFSDFTDEEVEETRKYINESCKILREIVFEEIRKKEFPKCPSRLKCMYCAKDFKTAKDWISGIKRMDSVNLPLQIVKLKVCGKIFKGDGGLMLRNTDSLSAKASLARKYWQGCSSSENPEILFVGKAEVVEIMEEF